MRVLELFGGIGACTTALRRIGVDVEVADYVEIDKYAVASYNAINGTNFEPQDICTWDKNIEADLIMHGSPCQDFSVAGKQAGGDVGSGTRSSLMYETIRIVGKLRPKYVVWENVKNLLSSKHRHNFDAYLETMKALGYTNYYQVLNAKDYGIPQNRERVFTISILGNGEFEFPPKQELKIRIKDVLEETIDMKGHDSMKIVCSDECLSSALTTMGGRNTEPKIIVDNDIKPSAAKNYERESEQISKSDKEIYQCECTSGWQDNKVGIKVSPTIRYSSNHTCVYSDYRIRKLTPKECWRLMGFDDESFEKAAKVNSNTQLYKQAGNSIVVNVLEKIFINLLKEE